ncbi:MAG: PQQ-binding-like beta-propeller repeat protein [Planctomycetota bacterium]|nr:PQQ-binding-like beta-propeller repeat protein [Planctomycetota bacterium]
MSASPEPEARIRWWPLVVIVGIASVALAWVGTGELHDRQGAYLISAAIGVSALTLIFIWLVWLSRLPGRSRLCAVLAAVVVVVGLVTTVRIRGVSGDLVPIFEWRWGSEGGSPDAGVRETSEAVRVPESLEGLVDSPQFFGPNRLGKLDGPRLARDWVARPPKLLWRRPVGAGWSGFAVASGRAITQEQRAEQELVVCYEVATGEPLWTHSNRARYFTTLGGTGPRATPTIVANRVLALGATGILDCLDLATGALIWSRDILEEHGAGLPEWGVAGSPLVRGNRVIVCAGGTDGRSLVAHDLATGAFVSGGGSAPAHYGSPLFAVLLGRPQIIIFHAHGVTGHDEQSLAPVWTYPWDSSHPHVCQPVVVGKDRIFVSSGYGTGGELLSLERDSAGSIRVSRRWRSLSMKAKFCNVIEKGGFVYGLDDGILACVDLASGRRRWKQGRYGHGQILLVGELLLVMGEGGEVALVEPGNGRELARIAVFDMKTWNPPALAGRYLFVRNHREAACYRLPIADG